MFSPPRVTKACESRWLFSNEEIKAESEITQDNTVQAELGIKHLAIPQTKLLSLRKQGFSEKQTI